MSDQNGRFDLKSLEETIRDACESLITDDVRDAFYGRSWPSNIAAHPSLSNYPQPHSNYSGNIQTGLTLLNQETEAAKLVNQQFAAANQENAAAEAVDNPEIAAAAVVENAEIAAAEVENQEIAAAEEVENPEIAAAEVENQQIAAAEAVENQGIAAAEAAENQGIAAAEAVENAEIERGFINMMGDLDEYPSLDPRNYKNGKRFRKP